MSIAYLPKRNADDFIKRLDILSYHVNAALRNSELGKVDHIVDGLAIPMKIHESHLRETYFGDWPEAPEVLLWYITSWDYSEISFDGVFTNRTQTLLPPYLLLSGGCDYTGWGCQSGSSAIFTDTEEDLVRWAMDKEMRDRWGINLDQE